MSRNRAPQTIAVSTGIGTDTAFGAVTPPIHLSTTYAFEGFGRARTHDYSRTANPTRDLLAETLASLEGGAGAVVVSSGMAAVDLALSLSGPGELIIAPHDCYAGTWRLLSARQAKGQLRVAFIDQTDEDAVKAALAQSPALLLIESPSNPLMRIVDIQHIATQAKSSGTRVVVDNTFLSPAGQQPLQLGADLVVHSTTKFLNGHSDVVGGAIIAADKKDAELLAAWANITGVTGAPFDAYLTLRGVRTLFVRLERQQRTAAAIAAFLQAQPAVEAVWYPGLPTHPGHQIAKRQQRSFGAMLSFELAGGAEATRRFLEAVEVFTLAEFLGGVESLVAHPVTMTHASMSAEAREVAGIKDSLVRLSIGLEEQADLIAGLAHGLRAASNAADDINAERSS